MNAAVLAASTATVVWIAVACGACIVALVAIIAAAVAQYRRSSSEKSPKEKKPVEKKAEKTPAKPKPEPKPAPVKQAPAPIKEPVKKPVKEPEPVKEPIKEPAEEPAPAPVHGVHALDTEFVLDAESEEGARAYDVQKQRFLFVRFNRSYEARLIQAQDSLKRYYEQLKNELLSYRGVKSRMGWKGENFRKGRVKIARLRVRGKLLCLYLALSPADYLDTKYKVEDVSDVAANEPVPLLYRIKNDRRCVYAKTLIADAMAKAGAEKEEREYVSYPLPYEETDALIERGLIRLVEGAEIQTPPPVSVKREVRAAEAHTLIKDEVAASMIEEEDALTPRIKNGKTGIVNVDTLSEYFESGERVTLEEVQKRVPFFDRRATALKVLARGVINKPLTVEADDFSLDAVKMIVLTGGHAVHKKH